MGAHARTEDRKLRELLDRALPPPGVQGVSGSMTVGRSHGRTRLAVHVTPLARHEWDFSHRGAAALVLVVDPESPSRIDAGIVAEALGLTPAESRLAVMLATGHSLRDIAERSGRSYGTVRWHLQRILHKQDVSRQADLVRRILSLDGFPVSPP
ncbi:MAG: hypothetical protein F4Z31_09185 [Gemmatimonadetes bacterium]|nr:hypothetical protein [Gemmatimonadota bacterium]MYE95339.1 hypothetical protein [Gemmatimonadota bacterium]MYJ11517.1 hypothetical protein [Gemmatimonadota bacterium]